MHGRFLHLGEVNPMGLGTRRVRAYVPGGESGPRPVLVLFDGQNLFDDHGSFAGGWRTHDAIDRFTHTRKALAPIIVAVDHGGLARIDELTPFHDGRRGGKFDATLGTLVDELMPRVRSRFEITATFIGGASLGGLAAIYAHLVRPDVFDGALAMSPSLWFTRAKFAQFIHARPRPERSRIYLDMGATEGAGRMLPIVEGFAEQLLARGWNHHTERGDLRVMMRPDARGKHNETAWRRRFPKAMRFLLAR